MIGISRCRSDNLISLLLYVSIESIFCVSKELDTLILDEDACLDHLEEILGNVKDDNRFVVNVVDYHSCDLFPERWFNLVLVLRSDTNILYDRLSNRGYSEKKIMENIQCEIFNVVEEEAKDSYNDDVVVVRRSNTVDDMDSNREKVVQYIITWMNQRNTINSN